MTTKEKLIEMCVSRGMFETQAEEVLAYAMPQLDSMGEGITWNAPAKDYPPAMYAVMFITVSRCAIEWIDENLPKAYFRKMFEV